MFAVPLLSFSVCSCPRLCKRLRCEERLCFRLCFKSVNFDDGALMRVYVKGFGCSSSVADAEVLAGCLERAGHVVVGDSGEAELLVYNTCAVKGPTENRMLSLLKKVSEGQRLVVAGCLPLVNFERLRREVAFDGVVGPAFGEGIVGVVEEVASGRRVVKLGGDLVRVPSVDLPRKRVNPVVGIVPVSYGCVGSCSYCCVRFARGRLRSYGVGDIVRRVERCFGEGVREFWLTSQDTAVYGRDLGVSLPVLLRAVCSVDGDFFVRVGMMTVNHLLGFLDEFLGAFSDGKVFKFLHLPVQSGDDQVLKRMNRFYSTDDFVGVVEEFRRVFPWSTVATDVIVGFPGESEEAFESSCRLVEKVKPDIVNVSKFFGRPGTLAVEMESQVVGSVVKERSRVLSGLVRDVGLGCNRRWVGWRGRILVDEVGKDGCVVGRNLGYKPVVVKGGGGEGLLGQFVSVEVVDAFQSYLLGEIV